MSSVRSEGRQVNRYHGDAVKEVLAKRAVFAHRLKVAIGRRDHACIDRMFLVCADRPHTPLLQDAKQLDLHR